MEPTNDRNKFKVEMIAELQTKTERHILHKNKDIPQLKWRLGGVKEDWKNVRTTMLLILTSADQRPFARRRPLQPAWSEERTRCCVLPS